MSSGELPKLPRRAPAGHKGTFGTVAVVGGSCTGGKAMIGAPALAALGALRAGAGLVRLVMPEPILAAGLTVCPSATGVALPMSHADDESSNRRAPAALSASASAEVLDAAIAAATALVIGPGLGIGPAEAALCLRSVQQEDVPVIVDADALNNLASVPELNRDFRAKAVLTPHPGEFARLAAALKLSADISTPAKRESGAAALALRLGCIVVLKGAGTVVSNGLNTWTCTRGHACLATAGTGDVLGGVIAGLAAQFPSLPLFDAARLAVQAHAIAGETWAHTHGAEAGLLATELAELIPPALEELRA